MTAARTTHQTLYNLYDPNSGEFFCTKSDAKRNHLAVVGWNNKDEDWKGTSGDNAAFRLYNINARGHHHATSVSERWGKIISVDLKQGIGRHQLIITSDMVHVCSGTLPCLLHDARTATRR